MEILIVQLITLKLIIKHQVLLSQLLVILK
nr:MAG TPA: hypothetical protein [Bacteriophage sp.]